jgi:transposase
MANLDKTTVRTEVERIKNDFDSLCQKGNVSAEVLALMNSMFLIIELILSIFLERTTKKTPVNSSLPPSQTEKGEDTALHPGSKSKGKPTGHETVNHRRVRETVTLIPVAVCEVCGENLEHTACLGRERRTKIDIVFEKVVDHVDAEIKQCPTCDTLTKGKFPANMPGPLQYGDGLKAFVINLLVCQMVALQRVAHLVQSMIGHLITVCPAPAPGPGTLGTTRHNSTSPGAGDACR